MSCCSSATGSCRSVCSKVSLVSLAANPEARENATRIFSKFCTPDSVDFWSCVNSTLEAVERNENWSGRGCCSSARSPGCRSGCATSASRLELKRWCRWSDEPEFDECLERRERADECCSSVANSTCRSMCAELFLRKPARQSALKAYGSKGCFHQVPRCLKNTAENRPGEDPKLYTHCCEQAPSPSCMETCRRALHTVSSIHDILDSLEESCGPVVAHSSFWSCFMKTSPASKTQQHRLPLNAAKLACCSRAQRRSCLNLCTRAFHSDWSAWQLLESNCLASGLENELRRCIEDADDACEMGCSGLSFCSKFNDRPTTLFRSCSATADESAKWEADHWARGGIIRGLDVPVRAAPNCPVETLHAAACLLQLRPCEARVHETRLCREDCLELLTSCVDWPAVKGHNAATLCAKLSPLKPDAPCVSLRPYLEDPREQNELPLGIEEDINMPCRNNPCPPNHICAVQPEERRRYKCIPGCPLGDMSKQLIPVGSWAQIAHHDHHGCYRMCQCSTNGKLERCRELSCPPHSTCMVHSSFVAHRSSFYLECNQCRCFEGEITCSRKSCSEPRLPSLPCDCPDHYVPVCARQGVTYASACLAKCAGLLPGEVEYNSCSSRDPCASRPCSSHERCVKRPRICLSPMHKPCDQFECVPLKCDHRDEPRGGTMCDTDNRQHPSLCSLVRSGSALAYRGPCLRGCSLRGPVCGINGETYPNECAAWSERSLVDYSGPCVAVGLVTDLHPKARCGPAVSCPPLARPGCLGATPPGACCPVCAGAARIFFSKKQLDRIYYGLQDETDKRVVTLEGMLEALARQLQVVECALRGLLSPEGDLFVLNQPISRRPSDLQLAACVAEMEKLVARIAERSPALVTEVPLGSLTRAEIAHSRVASSSASLTTSGTVFLLPMCALLVLLKFGSGQR
ncbi:hypothetical protein QAD02_022709, partial [Eretmocerus hayati]